MKFFIAVFESRKYGYFKRLPTEIFDELVCFCLFPNFTVGNRLSLAPVIEFHKPLKYRVFTTISVDSQFYYDIDIENSRVYIPAKYNKLRKNLLEDECFLLFPVQGNSKVYKLKIRDKFEISIFKYFYCRLLDTSNLTFITRFNVLDVKLNLRIDTNPITGPIEIFKRNEEKYKTKTHIKINKKDEWKKIRNNNLKNRR